MSTVGSKPHAIHEQKINEIDGREARTGGDSFHHLGQLGRQLSRQLSDTFDATGLVDPLMIFQTAASPASAQ